MVIKTPTVKRKESLEKFYWNALHGTQYHTEHAVRMNADVYGCKMMKPTHVR